MDGSPDQILRERDAARLLGVSHRTLQRWRYVGGGPSFIRCGLRAVGYRLGDLRAWIEARRHRSTSQYAK